MFPFSIQPQSNTSLTEMDPIVPTASQPSDVLMRPPADILIEPLIEPASSQTESSLASEDVSEPSDDFVDLTNNITDSPGDSIAAESAFADAARDTTEISLDEPTDEFVDIFGSETEAAGGGVVIANVTVEAMSDKSEVTSGATDPPGDGKAGSEAVQEVKETSTAPVIDFSGDLSASNTQQPQGSDKIVDPLVDLLIEASPAADAKKPGRAAVDLFEEEGSDLFTEPRQTKSTKQPQIGLFGEPDDDLFGEPLGATTKKTMNKEQKNTSVSTKASGDGSNMGGPLQNSNPAETADIFAEEAATTVPSIRNTSTVNTKTNGVQSKEETDIFAGRSTIFFVSNMVSGL